MPLVTYHSYVHACDKVMRPQNTIHDSVPRYPEINSTTSNCTASASNSNIGFLTSVFLYQFTSVGLLLTVSMCQFLSIAFFLSVYFCQMSLGIYSLFSFNSYLLKKPIYQQVTIACSYIRAVSSKDLHSYESNLTPASLYYFAPLSGLGCIKSILPGPVLPLQTYH